jgi:hypothetical protein
MAHPRILRAFAAFALAFVTIAAAPTAASADVGSGLAPQVRADTEPGDVGDFSYASWDAVYQVGLDDEGRARTVVRACSRTMRSWKRLRTRPSSLS